MIFKLNRLFLFSNKSYRRSFLILHGIFFALPLAFIIITNQAAIWNVGFVIIENIIIYFAIKHNYPKSFEIVENTITFTEHNNLGRRDGNFKILITLSDLRNVSFSQNSFEKLFKVGRIHLKATPTAEIISGTPTNEEKPFLNNSYTFYGVTKFEKAKEEIVNISKLAKVETNM